MANWDCHWGQTTVDFSIALVAILAFCAIIKIRDHHKF